MKEKESRERTSLECILMIFGVGTIFVTMMDLLFIWITNLFK